MNRSEILLKYFFKIKEQLEKDLEKSKHKTSVQPWLDVMLHHDKIRFIQNQIFGIKTQSKEYHNLNIQLDNANQHLEKLIKIREKQLKNMDKYIKEQAQIEYELQIIDLEIFLNQ